MDVETADSGMRTRREHVAVDGQQLQVDVRWADERRAGAGSYDYARGVRGCRPALKEERRPVIFPESERFRCWSSSGGVGEAEVH